MAAMMIIEFGEPLHVMGMIFFLVMFAFLLGMQVGSFKNEHKKAD